jgi:hypothetical protein
LPTWWLKTVILATWQVEIGKIVVLGEPGQKNREPVLKIIKAKTAGSMTQVVERLPGKCKALSSNPSTIRVLM